MTKCAPLICLVLLTSACASTGQGPLLQAQIAAKTATASVVAIDAAEQTAYEGGLISDDQHVTDNNLIGTLAEAVLYYVKAVRAWSAGDDTQATLVARARAAVLERLEAVSADLPESVQAAVAVMRTLLE